MTTPQSLSKEGLPFPFKLTLFLLSLGIIGWLVFSPPAPITKAQGPYADLSTWTPEGFTKTTDAEWIPDPVTGAVITQTKNGNPTFLVNNADLIDATVTGRFRVNQTTDNDPIGFVFGYKNPLNTNPAQDIPLETFLFSFGGSGNGSKSRIVQISNYNMSKDLTPADSEPCLWNFNANGCTTLQTFNQTWTIGTDYYFELKYTETEIELKFGTNPTHGSNPIIYSATGSYQPGRFGFYNYSQDNVLYGDFSSVSTDPPEANDDSYMMNENTAFNPNVLAKTTGTLFANDINPVLQNPLIATLASDVQHGTLTLNADGGFIYTPTLNYTGIDTFSYNISNGQLSSVTPAVVTITVNYVNRAPTDIHLSNDGIEIGLPSGSLVGNLSASDEDSSSFTYSLVSGTGDTDNGKFQIQGNQLKSNQVFNSGDGPFSIRIRVSDGIDTFEKQFTIVAFDGPRIDVYGNSRGIPNGDTSPSIGKDTDFGSVITNTERTHTFEIRNHGTDSLTLSGTPKVEITGAAAADFTVTVQPNSPVLTDTDVTTFTIRFSPSTTGLRHATVSIANNTNTDNPYIFAIQGTGVPIPVPHIAVVGNQQTILNGDTTPSSADATDFGNLILGTPTARNYELHNNGDADLNLTGNPKVSISGPNAADFTVTTQPASPISARQQSGFAIQFNPSATGLRQATVTIASNDGEKSPYTFAIQGTGSPVPVPHIDVLGQTHHIESGDTSPSPQDNTDFGSVVSNSGQEDLQFVIRNHGTANLNLTGNPPVELSGAGAGQFQVILQPTTPVVSGTGQSAFTIRFQPTSDGQHQATVTIASNDNEKNPYTFLIQGTGIPSAAPGINVLGYHHLITNGDNTPEELDGTDFGGVKPGETAQQSFEILNNGNLDLTLTGSPQVGISGPGAGLFSVTTQPHSTLTPDHSTQFVLQFAPISSTTGLATATVTITSDDTTRSPYTFVVEGTAGSGIYLPIIMKNATP